MKQTVKQKIMAIRRTLESVSVSGKDNLDKLLGCIIVLEELEAIPVEEDQKAEESEETDG